MGLTVCNEEAGIFCCQREDNCCANATLHLALGRGTVIREVVRPTSTEMEESHDEPKKKSRSQDMVVGVASGFSIVVGFAILSWIFILVRRRLQLNKLKLAVGGDEEELTRRPSNFEKAELDAVETVTELNSSPWRVGGDRNPVELDSNGNERSELETLPTTTTSMMTRSGSESFILSPASPGSATTDHFGTLVTPIVLEMEAPASWKHAEAQPSKSQSSPG
jgi:hypothetical protein